MGYLSSLVDDLEEQMNTLVDRLTEIVNEELDQADKDTYKAYGVIEQKKAKEIFDKSVTEFYGAYKPNVYKREANIQGKTGGLFDVFYMDLDEDGMINTDVPGFTNLFDESQMHTGRDGSDLFDKVFMHGWHGGAAGIDGGKIETWGAHPSPGTPYYRKRGKVRYPDGTVKWHKYGKWGRRAEHSTPPASLFASYFSAAESGELQDTFDRIENENYEKAMERVSKRQEALETEIFG